LTHPAPGSGVRVLTVLVGSDVSDDSLRALDLHRHLASLGAQVRTVALGPGTSGGLDAVVPVLAPHPRAPAAGLQLRREARWCDVLVLHGSHPGRVAHRWVPRGGGPRRVVVLGAADGSWTARRLRPLAGCAAVITTSSAQLHRLESLGVAPRLLPAAALLPSVDVGDAQRRAARRSLGLTEESAVLGVAAPLDRSPPGGGSASAALVSAAGEAGWSVIAVRGDGTGRDEWCGAACDAVLVERSCADGAPPRGALVVAAGGGLLMGLGTDLDGLVAEASGVVVGDARQLAGALRDLLEAGTGGRANTPLARRGSRGAEVVRRRFGFAQVGEAWVRAVHGPTT
jgi:hypothetical protein